MLADCLICQKPTRPVSEVACGNRARRKEKHIGGVCSFNSLTLHRKVWYHQAGLLHSSSGRNCPSLVLSHRVGTATGVSADTADHPMQAQLLPVASPLLADCSPPANILLLLGGSHLPVTLQSGSDAGAPPPAHVLPCGKYRDRQGPSASSTEGSCELPQDT